MVAGCLRQVVVLCITIVWELAWADSTLIVLDEWSSYRGACISRFDCTAIKIELYRILLPRSIVNLILKMKVINK